MTPAQPGDTILLIAPDRKRFIERLRPGATKSTHQGIVRHDDIIGRPLGRTVDSHLGRPFTVLRPSMEELLISVQRETQIVYPKDIGYTLLKLSVVPGARVIEAGTGSGALTTALARYVTPGGRVYSYEVRPEMRDLAMRNLERAGLLDAVTLHRRDIEAGFVEEEVDALFLDVREPWLYVDVAVRAMADGAFLGALVPTVNQVAALVAALHKRPFVDVEVVEILLRQYKPVPARLRPMDHLTAHTGYLVFGRKVAADARAALAGGADDALDVAADDVPNVTEGDVPHRLQGDVLIAADGDVVDPTDAEKRGDP